MTLRGYGGIGLVLAALWTSAVGLWSGATEAQGRMISVNGIWLTPEQILLADRCAGFPLPNGHYWLDANSGYWGVVGGPVVGWAPPACRGSGGGGGQAWFRSGPGGSIGGYGSCFEYNDPSTGASVGNC
jgi:hypothetical protein